MNTLHGLTQRIILFTGRFGSGKTEIALNYALRHADQSPILVDLDVVTPYFRSRERREEMRQLGIEVITPYEVGQELDTPAIDPRIYGTLQQPSRPVILDVGGDRQGARAVGQFATYLASQGYSMGFVVNPYRPFTTTVEGIVNSVREIEASSRLHATALVSNPNLMHETLPEDILAGHQIVEQAAEALNLPIAFIAVERAMLKRIPPQSLPLPVLALERFFVLPWVEQGEA